jgi:hypothetical protein
MKIVVVNRFFHPDLAPTECTPRTSPLISRRWSRGARGDEPAGLRRRRAKVCAEETVRGVDSSRLDARFGRGCSAAGA